MSNACFGWFVAQLDLKVPAWAHDEFIIVCAVIIVTVLAVVWAAFYRKKRRRRTHRHHHHHHANEGDARFTAADTQAEPEGAVRKRRNWRRSKHRERSLNPTLAETRGLPPLRDESTPPAGP